VRTVGRTAVVAGTATAVVGGVSRHQQSKAAEAEKAAAYDQMAQQEQMQEAAAAEAAEDPVAQLQKLADMKAQGLLSDEEFAAMKAKIVGV
jgi:membrane protease subunit (stomatin/prohibitin family)